MIKQYRTWKGFESIPKPNDHKCSICKKISSDWKDIRNKPLISYVHRLCVFKMGHYGLTPEQYAKWKREYNKVRNKVLERDNFQCVRCKNNCKNCQRDLREKGKIKLNVHHIIPVIRGGSNDVKNLVTVCQFCNRVLDSKRHSGLK